MTDWQRIYQGIQDLMASDNAVLNASVFPRWMGDTGYFWYERQKTGGCVDFCAVQASTGQARTLFSQEEVAALLAERFSMVIDPPQLLLKSVEVLPGFNHATFSALDRHWIFDIPGRALSEGVRCDDPGWVISPDRKTALLLKEANLWARDLVSGLERAVTTDGRQDNAYADVPQAYRPYKARFGRGAEGCWSPDSRYFLTVQTDERHVADLPLVDFAPAAGGRPTVIRNPTSLPGDVRATEFRVLAIEVETGRQIEARYPRLPAVRMNDTVFASGLSWWSRDSRTAYFVDIERGERRANVVSFDVTTGRCRNVFSEESDTYLELGVSVYARALVQPLIDSNELIWYSERTGRGHLYLYDLQTGRCKNAITAGEWQVRDILHVDTARREVAIRAGGVIPGEDPYLCKPCLVSLDAGPVKILAREPGDHIIWRQGELSLMLWTLNTGADVRAVSGFSPDGAYFVETIGAMDRLPVTVLRDRAGRKIAELESADGAALPRNWRWPEVFSVKAADGQTDLYGILYKPARFDPNQSYPVIDVIYGGPQMSHVPKSAFAQVWPTLTLLELAAFAELGAFAFIVDGRGTAERERAFRLSSYGAIETASNLEDHITTARALAKLHPQMDLDRVAITGFSGGGYMAALAACRYGDFFKTAVACSGNLDQSLFWLGWGERYHGLYEESLYAQQAVKTYVSGLKGKLLLIHGLLDWSVHPACLFQLVQALIDANKDFDLLLLPRATHEVPGYAVRRRLDYFVKHLFGEEPVTQIKFSLLADRVNARLMTNSALAVAANR